MVKLYKIAWVALGLTLFLSCADNDSSNFPSEEEVAKKNSSSSNLNGSSSSNLETASSSSGLVNSSSSNSSSSSTTDAASSSSTTDAASSSSVGNSSSSSTTDAASSSSVGNSSSSSTTGAASSSSVGNSSSSSVASSSSEATSGTFTDSRGDKVYKWVKIGTQTWMAENLNLADSGHCGVGSNLISNVSEACLAYGRLYDWSEAMKLPASCNSLLIDNELCEISETHKGVCPEGWHLPNNAEWDKLIEYVGGIDIAGTKLKAKSGWNEYGNGTDNYGFTAYPGGIGRAGGGVDFQGAGDSGYWWSATEYRETDAYSITLSHNLDKAIQGISDKQSVMSVRCVKN